MAKVGYARVSSRAQNHDWQIDELKAAGCDEIFTDHGVTGNEAAIMSVDMAARLSGPCRSSRSRTHPRTAQTTGAAQVP